jgi:prepilin-type N-terminal cleavage/methylation domain-containing protein
MKSAFTMIELIFVIIILGILAAVSLPKFIGISDTANSTICEAFVGTLNRTVSHTIWSESILVDPNDYTVTEAKLLQNIDEETLCGTLEQYADATTGTSFSKTIGDYTYTVTATEANNTSPAQWSWTQQ